MYLEQYGGSGDVWIGKDAWVGNGMYLNAAKASFKNFQRLCQLEWTTLESWHSKSNFQTYGVTRKNALRAYFLAAANIFEPSQAKERLAWARTAILAEAISWLLREPTIQDSTDHSLVRALSELIDPQPLNATVGENLREAWRQWLMALTQNGPSVGGDTALLLARTVEICSGRYQVSVEQQKHELAEFSRLELLTSSICDKLSTTGSLSRQDGGNMESGEINLDQEVDLHMQELSHLVLEGNSGIDTVTCQTYLSVVKSFYYVAYSSPETIHGHISKVLFEDVL
uniref:Uncharacterized protein n=1 Tax=Leersia perrieri TaxID=77586 RepID=A0A0D9XS82_9ORYZ